MNDSTVYKKWAEQAKERLHQEEVLMRVKREAHERLEQEAYLDYLKHKPYNPDEPPMASEMPYGQVTIVIH